MSSGNVKIDFRISNNDFSELKHYLWFRDFHDKRINKSQFYKSVVLPKIKATRRGEEEEFDKIIQYVDLMGVSKVLEVLEDSTNAKPINEDQITNIIQTVLKSVQSKGVQITQEQQQEIIKDVRKPSKDELQKLLKLRE